MPRRWKVTVEPDGPNPLVDSLTLKITGLRLNQLFFLRLVLETHEEALGDVAADWGFTTKDGNMVDLTNNLAKQIELKLERAGLL